jgi:hypothetical protein
MWNIGPCTSASERTESKMGVSECGSSGTSSRNGVVLGDETRAILPPNIMVKANARMIRIPTFTGNAIPHISL